MNDATKLVLVIGGFAGAAVVGVLARSRPWARYTLVFLAGFLPFFLNPDVNFASHAHYRGSERGFSVTVFDLLAVALLLGLRGRIAVNPYRIPMLMYLIPASVSLAFATVPLFAGFGVWKILRSYFFAWALLHVCRDPKLPPHLLRGLACGLVFEGVWCLKLRYLDGVHQVYGTFAHQNSLGMALNMIVPILFALLLRRHSWLGSGAVVAGGISVVLTLSRGSIAGFVLALGLTFLMNIVRRGWTSRTKWIAAASTLAAMMVVMRSADTLIQRFEAAPQSSANARERFNDAALMMAEEHPFLGIGLNNYSYLLDTEYAEKAGIGGYDTSGVCHNIYLLTLAELGWWGLLSYVVLLAVPLILALRTIRHPRDDVRVDVTMGCAGGLIAMYAQGALEWIARLEAQMYMFWILAALIAGLRWQLQRSRTRAL